MCFVSSEKYQNFKERKMEELLTENFATMNQNNVHIYWAEPTLSLI